MKPENPPDVIFWMDFGPKAQLVVAERLLSCALNLCDINNIPARNLKTTIL